jgi:hypothetical protein
LTAAAERPTEGRLSAQGGVQFRASTLKGRVESGIVTLKAGWRYRVNNQEFFQP